MMFYDPKWDKKTKELEGDKQWRDVLFKAADNLEQDGWVCNTFTEKGSHCALAAINIVLGRRTTNTDPKSGANQRLFGIVTEKLARSVHTDDWYVSGGDAGKIMNWNDHWRNTGAAVIATLRKVATEG